MRFFAQLRQKATLKPVKPEPIAAFRAAVGAKAGMEERCAACLRELEAVLAHIDMMKKGAQAACVEASQQDS